MRPFFLTLIHYLRSVSKSRWEGLLHPADYGLLSCLEQDISGNTHALGVSSSMSVIKSRTNLLILAATFP